MVSVVDGVELPLQGLILIPEERLAKLEAVASSSRELLDRAAAASREFSQGAAAEVAREQLKADLAALAEIWDIPRVRGKQPSV